VRPFVTQRHSKPRSWPGRFSDAQEIATWSSELAGDRQSAGEREGSGPAHDRLLLGSDLCSRGSMEKVAESVFLLTPSNVEVSPEERQRLQENGLFRS